MNSTFWHNICCDRISWILTNQKYARNSDGNIQHQMIIPKHFMMMLRDYCAAQYNQNDEYREFGHSETGFSIGIAYYNYRFVEKKTWKKHC